MKKDFTSCMATFFYVGQFPFGPGTLASVVGMFIYMILQQQMFVYLALLGLITFLGFRTSGRMEKKLKQKDPGCVVIDEVGFSATLTRTSCPVVMPPTMPPA